MTKRRHSAIQFNPTEWLASTARMPRIVRSVYFDLCVYCWEHAAAVPPSEVFLMISDLPDGQGEAIIENLVQSGKLVREGEFIFAPWALAEAERAQAVYEAKSRGGRGGAPAPVEEPQRAPEPPAEPKGAWDVPAHIEKMEPSPIGASEIAQAWNRLAANRGLKQIAKMTQERIDRLNARIADHGAETILAAIEALADNELVLSTKPTFDQLLQPDMCARMVGNPCGEASGEVEGEPVE
jgi:hypothetical protein